MGMMKRSGFARKVYVPPPVAPLRALESRPNYAQAFHANPTMPKRPALRNQRLRDLARGEECCVKLGGACSCLPETTVWAHTNRLADQKGMGYKSSDERGMLAGYECHTLLDQGRKSAEEIDAVVAMAQQRTRVRLREIADSYSVPTWKQQAAQWALNALGA